MITMMCSLDVINDALVAEDPRLRTQCKVRSRQRCPQRCCSLRGRQRGGLGRVPGEYEDIDNIFSQYNHVIDDHDSDNL